MSARFDTNRRQVLTGLTGLAAGALLAPGRLDAGSLEPPGPPGPTMLPLSDIEPRTIVNEVNTPGNGEAMFVISEPGSYYLVDDLIVQAGKIGIVIDADDVTLDLRGHLVAMGLDRHGGIRCGPGGRSGIVVRNGALTGEGFPIDLACDGGHSSIVERILVKKHSPNGIVVGPASCVLSCAVMYVTNDAIVAGDRSMVLSCRVESGSSGEASPPVRFGDDCVVADCAAFPAHVVVTGDNCLIHRCDLTMAVADGCLVSDCATTLNTSNHPGLVAHGECLVSNCMLLESQVLGLSVIADRNVIAENHSLVDSGAIPLSVAGASNLIIRNVLSRSSGQVAMLAGGNSWRLIAGPDAGDFSGDEGGASMDPNNVNANLARAL